MSHLANIRLRTKLLGAFGVVLVVLVIVASAAYRTTTLNQEASDAVIHTFEVIGIARTGFADLVDMETSYRGFLLSGDEAFLQPYLNGSAEVDGQLAHLRELTADNPSQVERWHVIEAILADWRQTVTEPGIALRREVTAGRATQADLMRWVATGEGRRRFLAMRSTFDEALAVERSLLEQRQVEASDRRVRLLNLLTGGTVVAVGLGLVLALALSVDLAGPVARLATTARQIADGQLDRRIRLQRGDEIGLAAAAFDRMAEQLQAMIVRSEASARELARSNADLEQFAYVASHDLQEPLRAVVSYLQLLERRYSGQLDDRAEKYIGYAVDGGKRMQTLISDLLTYSRVGRRDVAVAPVDTNLVLDRVTASLRLAIEESGAEVTHDPLPTVVGDGTQLTQLFQNLVGNAIKFRGEAAPRIHISAERQSASASDPQHGAWIFSVRDNGIGIAPEYRERVFVLFQRLHGRDEYSGTGIGLAVCKRIVERHGGTLWVDDTPGGGTTFRFTIPDPGDTSS